MKRDAKRENPSRDWALGKGASFTARLFLAAVLLAALTPLFAGRLSAQAAASPTEAPALSVQAVGATSITLSWSAVTGAESYELYRWRAGHQSWVQVGGALTATTYSDTGLAAGTYYYVMRAVNAGGPGPWSDFVSATPSTSATPTPTSATPTSTSATPTPTSATPTSTSATPTSTSATPTSTSATPTPTPTGGMLVAPALSAQAADATSVTLTWNAVAGASGYELWRYDSSWSQVGGALTTTTYTDSGLAAGDLLLCGARDQCGRVGPLVGLCAGDALRSAGDAAADGGRRRCARRRPARPRSRSRGMRSPAQAAMNCGAMTRPGARSAAR